MRRANFRRLYNAVVVAVHRNGVRLTNKIGNIVIAPGDTLLLQTRTEFAEQFRRFALSETAESNVVSAFFHEHAFP